VVVRRGEPVWESQLVIWMVLVLCRLVRGLSTGVGGERLGVRRGGRKREGRHLGGLRCTVDRGWRL